MTLDNEFIAPDNKVLSNEPEKKPKKKNKKIDNEKASWMEKFSFRWNTKKFTTILGMFVLFFSFFISIYFSSMGLVLKLSSTFSKIFAIAI